MILLLLGLCIVLFDVNLATGNSYIGIFPDVLGYAMIFWALKKADVTSPAHEKLEKWVKLSILISAAVYIAALAGVVQLLEGWLWVALDLGSFALESYVTYLIVAQMRDHDPTVKGDYAKKFISFWRVSVLFGAVAYCCIISPASTMLLMGFSAVADISLLSFCFKRAKQCAFI